jgi:hypothetical protein
LQCPGGAVEIYHPEELIQINFHGLPGSQEQGGAIVPRCPALDAAGMGNLASGGRSLVSSGEAPSVAYGKGASVRSGSSSPPPRAFSLNGANGKDTTSEQAAGKYAAFPRNFTFPTSSSQVSIQNWK